MLPLDNALATRFASAKPSLTAGRSTFSYTTRVTGIPRGDAPNVLGRSFSITAEIDVKADDEGMLNTNGGRFGGYGLYLIKGKPVFTYNVADYARFRWEGKDPLSPGKHTVAFEFTYDGPGMGKGGTGALKVDGTPVDTKQAPATLAITTQWDETFDVGSDTGTPVDDNDYNSPFNFTGKLERLTVKMGPNEMQPAEKQAVEKKVGERD